VAVDSGQIMMGGDAPEAGASSSSERQHYDPQGHDEWALAVEPLLRDAVKQLGLGTRALPVAEFMDEELLKAQTSRLVQAFLSSPGHAAVAVTHCFAVKANPHRAVLRHLRNAGMLGAECASVEEVKLALEVGFPADRIVYDSPCKPPWELQWVLQLGCRVNLDSLHEVRVVEELLQEGAIDFPDAGKVGLRLNPCVGLGYIEETSTAMRASKFGVAMDGEGTEAESLLALYKKHAWLTGCHCHVGSQGCDMKMLVRSAAKVAKFAELVNALAGHRQVVYVDLGGGLGANYASADPFSKGRAYEDYVAELRSVAPSLFSGKYELLTEFGRSLVVKCGLTVSRIEATKECDGVPVAIMHTGANQFLREAYCPSSWFHRITVHAACGGAVIDQQLVPLSLAGPLCFSGDLLARRVPMPPLSSGNLVCVHDTGGYCSSMYSYYNSRSPPPVYTFHRRGDVDNSAFSFTLIKSQSVEETLSFWGDFSSSVDLSSPLASASSSNLGTGWPLSAVADTFYP
jgi:diaminopimelate decarboxylase